MNKMQNEKSGVSRRHFLQSATLIGAAAAMPVMLAPGTVHASGTLLAPEALRLRRSEDRGYADHGWLKARHSFSFARYRDPDHMGFRALRVINEDRIAGGKGFAMHPHRDMEIVTYVLDGALEHKDSLGNGSVIRPAEIQRMSAGTGIRHSEFNPNGTAGVHLLQIWLHPDRKNHEPSYGQMVIPSAGPTNPIRRIAGPTKEEGAVRIHQDAQIFACNLNLGRQVSYDVPPGRHAWVQIARGDIRINGVMLNQGDAVAVSKTGTLLLEAASNAEALIFDLA